MEKRPKKSVTFADMNSVLRTQLKFTPIFFLRINFCVYAFSFNRPFKMSFIYPASGTEACEVPAKTFTNDSEVELNVVSICRVLPN